jgi:hypothetical protein
MTREASNYSITLTMRDWNDRRDQNILAALAPETRKRFDGTGFGLEEEERELVFFSPNRADATEVKRDIEKALKFVGYPGKVRILSMRGPRDDA